MDRRDYTDRVLSSLRRVTEKEREAIRSELDGHIEDHMEALRELGYDEELAEERAIAAMGEPDEVGRELNKQYTGCRWLLASRAAVVLTVDAVRLRLCWPFLGMLGHLGLWTGISSPHGSRMNSDCHAGRIWRRSERLAIPRRSSQLETTSCG